MLSINIVRKWSMKEGDCDQYSLQPGNWKSIGANVEWRGWISSLKVNATTGPIYKIYLRISALHLCLAGRTQPTTDTLVN